MAKKGNDTFRDTVAAIEFLKSAMEQAPKGNDIIETIIAEAINKQLWQLYQLSKQTNVSTEKA